MSKSIPMKFVVALHSQFYQETDGGLTVLLTLAKRLNDRGHDTTVSLPYGHYGYEKNNVYTNYFNKTTVEDDETVVIYIDSIIGNPLRAKRIVRFIGYGSHWYPDYDSNEMTYYYAPFDKNHFPTKVLRAMYVHPFVKNMNLPREGSCYVVKKGMYDRGIREALLNENIKKLTTGKEITRIPLQELVELFNRTKYFYCFDPCTFLVIIALLCGCVVVQHPPTGYSESEWHYAMGYDLVGKLKGLSYGYDNIEEAESTISEAAEQCMRIVSEGDKHIDSFIKDLETKNVKYEPFYKFNESPYAFQFIDRRI